MSEFMQKLQSIAADQGWDDRSMYTLLAQFIDESNPSVQAECLAYLDERAADENDA